MHGTFVLCLCVKLLYINIILLLRRSEFVVYTLMMIWYSGLMVLCKSVPDVPS